MKLGRRTLYTDELAKEICEQIAHGNSLVSILKKEGMPSYQTVLDWLLKAEQGIEPYKNFLGMYTRAREDQAEYLADEIIDIADNSTNDTIVDEKGRARCDHEWVHRSRLRVDARKWVAAKLKPRKYGDFARNEHTGPNGGPIESSALFIIDAGPDPYKSK